MIVHRYVPPARRSTRAETVFHRRSRSGSVSSAKASSGETGRVTLISGGRAPASSSTKAVLPVRDLASPIALARDGGRVVEGPVELVGPEPDRLGPQPRHPIAIKPVQALAAALLGGDELG